MSLRSLPLLALFAVIAMIAASCGSEGTDAGGPSQSCLESDPNCDDVGDTADLEPALNLGLADDEGPIAISFGGYFLADENGPRLCATLAESFPPQCFDVIIEISGNTADVIEFVDASIGEADSAPLSNVDGVWWTDEWTTLTGLLSDGKLLLDLS